MRNAKIALVLCWTLAGCAASDGGLISRIKERIRGSKDATDDATPSSNTRGPSGTKRDEIVTTGSTGFTVPPMGEVTESIIARVNSDVILSQDVFNSIRPQLEKARQEMPPAQFAQYQTSLVQQTLRNLIERQLLIQEAKRNLPEPMVKHAEALADKEFGKRIEAEMTRMQVNTESELRRKMLEMGESLDQIRDFQRGSFLAQQYLLMQLQQRIGVSREEMVDFYNLHRDEFKQPGGVVWSEILLTFEKCGSREEARDKAIEIVNQLRSGGDFSQLAKTESEGATAPNGGHWELTAKGSYIVKAVDEAIFSLPQGKISDPIEGPKGWHIVRVDEKKDGGETSFVEAQDRIKNVIREEKIAKESQRYIKDLMQRAHVTTEFDRPNQSKPSTIRSN